MAFAFSEPHFFFVELGVRVKFRDPAPQNCSCIGDLSLREVDYYLKKLWSFICEMKIYMNKVKWTVRGHSFSCKACHPVFITYITGLQLMN